MNSEVDMHLKFMGREYNVILWESVRPVYKLQLLGWSPISPGYKPTIFAKFHKHGRFGIGGLSYRQCRNASSSVPTAKLATELK
ncbi:hypothetical protein QTP88_014599 [Uroleucon formosanum]